MVATVRLRISQKIAKGTKERTLFRAPRYGGQVDGAQRAPLAAVVESLRPSRPSVIGVRR
jgi:hypothetical protein